MMYRFMHGNNLGTLVFLWKTPKGGEATQNAKLVTELNQRQKVYSTQEMRRDFIQRYTRLNDAKCHAKASILGNIYKSLTGDSSCSRSAAEKEVDERVAKLAEEAFE